MKITFDWLEAEGYASVTDFCRDLVKDHQEEEIPTLEVYRGEMLCLTVNVAEAAKLYPRGYEAGFRQYRPSGAGKKGVGAV